MWNVDKIFDFAFCLLLSCVDDITLITDPRVDVRTAIVGLLGGTAPRLWELQPALPSLPVPDLAHTCKLYLSSVGTSCVLCASVIVMMMSVMLLI